MRLRRLIVPWAAVGTVIKDPGDLGRLLRVRFEIEGAREPFETEIAADDVKAAT
jgi:hypothetical protein